MRSAISLARTSIRQSASAQAGRFPTKDLVPYIIAQVAGGLLAGFILLQIASGPAASPSMAARPVRSPAMGMARCRLAVTAAAAFLCEVVLTAVFLIVIMGATHGKAPAGFAPLAIGLSLTLIHLISIPVTNTSVNPARSTAVAFFAGSGAVSQLWLFWVARCCGAIGGIISSGSATTAEACAHHCGRPSAAMVTSATSICAIAHVPLRLS